MSEERRASERSSLIHSHSKIVLPQIDGYGLENHQNEMKSNSTKKTARRKSRQRAETSEKQKKT
jgi:hypothetical protein